MNGGATQGRPHAGSKRRCRRARVALWLLLTACRDEGGGAPAVDAAAETRDVRPSALADGAPAALADGAPDGPTGQGPDGQGPSDARGGDASPAYRGHRDCLPTCIAHLRQSCQRPLPTEGTCVEQKASGAGSRTCYSNGVRELREIVGDQLRTTFTMPDGQTPCYVVDQGATPATLVYRTPGGATVATVTYLSNDDAEVTCEGGTRVVTSGARQAADCRDLNLDGCTAGSCP